MVDVVQRGRHKRFVGSKALELVERFQVTKLEAEELRSGRAAFHAFTTDESKLLDEAAGLLGSRPDALKWVHEQIPSLDGLTPFQLIETPEGTAALANYMNQIRYGVYI
jgi:uncharacterized protein (DUF2384 family)